MDHTVAKWLKADVELGKGKKVLEMCRLLEFVLSNSFWANGELTPEFRQPFDMLAAMATVGAQKMAAGLLTSSHHQEELPVLDTYRNFLAVPTIEGKLTLMAIRTLDFAA